MKIPHVVMAMVLCASAPLVLAAPVGDTCRKRSAEILGALEQGDFDAATKHFDAAMQTVLNGGKLREVWVDVLPAKAGAYQRHESARQEPQPDGALVQTQLQFANASLEMRVSCDMQGGVRGLFFTPPQLRAAPLVVTPGAAPEQAVEVASPLGPLPGTLLLPAGAAPFPAVLLVAGSGPNDRDETIGPNKPLADIAHGLAEAGIASLRYDKRTRVYATQMSGTPLTVDDEVTDDAVSAARLLLARPGIDAHRVFVLGHSLGALMAPRIAEREPRIAGLVLLAAPARLDLDVVLRQTRYLAGLQHATQQQTDDAVAPIVAARTAMILADPQHPPAGEFYHAPASYWLSLRDYRAIEVARGLPQRILLLQGSGDYQVTPHDDFAQWQKAFAQAPRATLKQFPGLGHLFMPAGDPPSPADYAKAGHVDGGVIDSIVRWVNADAAH